MTAAVERPRFLSREAARCSGGTKKENAMNNKPTHDIFAFETDCEAGLKGESVIDMPVQAVLDFHVPEPVYRHCSYMTREETLEALRTTLYSRSDEAWFESLLSATDDAILATAAEEMRDFGDIESSDIVWTADASKAPPKEEDGQQ
jgi:hypothetical protein